MTLKGENIRQHLVQSLEFGKFSINAGLPGGTEAIASLSARTKTTSRE